MFKGHSVRVCEHDVVLGSAIGYLHIPLGRTCVTKRPHLGVNELDQGWQALLSSRKLSATQTVCMKPPPPLYLCISGFSDSPTVPTVLTLLPLVLSQLLFAAQSRKGRRTRPSLNPTPQDECWVRVRVLMGRWHLVGNPAISG